AFRRSGWRIRASSMQHWKDDLVNSGPGMQKRISITCCASLEALRYEALPEGQEGHTGFEGFGPLRGNDRVSGTFKTDFRMPERTVTRTMGLMVRSREVNFEE